MTNVIFNIQNKIVKMALIHIQIKNDFTNYIFFMKSKNK